MLREPRSSHGKRFIHPLASSRDSARLWCPAGMRTLIVSPLPNLTAEGPLAPPEGVAAPGDTWVAYPDNHNYSPVVATLRLANATFGSSYSWLLYGDDDTVFITENVLSMLRSLRLDPSVPYYITDDQASAFSGVEP